MELTGAVAAVALAVRVYQPYGVAVEDLRAAQTHAQHILGEAGIAVTWVVCGTRAPREDSSRQCDAPLGSNELIVRVQPNGPPATGRDASLGYSLVNAQTGEHAAVSLVYADRIQSLARRVAVDARQVLGRAIAHEIGHLLLNAADHSTHGLMRARWSQTELRRNAPDDWKFLNAEADAMRAAIASRTSRRHANARRTPCVTPR